MSEAPPRATLSLERTNSTGIMDMSLTLLHLTQIFILPKQTGTVGSYHSAESPVESTDRQHNGLEGPHPEHPPHPNVVVDELGGDSVGISLPPAMDSVGISQTPAMTAMPAISYNPLQTYENGANTYEDSMVSSVHQYGETAATDRQHTDPRVAHVQQYAEVSEISRMMPPETQTRTLPTLLSG